MAVGCDEAVDVGEQFRCAPGISARTLTLRGRDVELEGLRTTIRSGDHAVVAAPAHGGCSRLVAMFRRDPGVHVVDDGHRLDDASRRRLLADARDGPRLIIALHAEGRVALGAVTRPWQALGARAVLLGQLGHDDQVVICEDLLAGPVDRSGCDALFRLSGGRPGDLVELVLGSLEVGVLRHGSAGWALAGAPCLDRLVPRLEAQLHDPALRGAARVLARVGLASPAEAIDLVGRAALQRLWARGVVALENGGGPPRLSIVRPSLAAWLRGRRRVRPLDRSSHGSVPGVRGSESLRTSAWDVVAHAVDAGLPEARRRVRAIDDAPSSPDEALAGSMARMVVAARSLDADTTARQATVLRAAPDPGGGLPRPQVLADAAEVERRAFAGLDLTGQTRSCAVARRRAAVEGRTQERALWNVVSASVAIASGRPQRAGALLAATRAAAQRRGTAPGVALMTVRQAWASAQSGSVTAAQALLDGTTRQPFLQPTEAWRDYLEALIRWVIDPSMPPREFEVIARDAIESDDRHLILEVSATQLRLERASPRTFEFIRYLEGWVDGGRVEVVADHARAVAARDPDRLVGVAARWCAAGRLSDAADTLLRAADLESGRRRDAYRRRAAGLLGACEGAWIPHADELDPVALDDEAVRIGMLAIRGLRNREISARLGITTRAVESRLSRLYGRLGVSDRRELDVFFASMFRRASTREG